MEDRVRRAPLTDQQLNAIVNDPPATLVPLATGLRNLAAARQQAENEVALAAAALDAAEARLKAARERLLKIIGQQEVLTVILRETAPLVDLTPASKQRGNSLS